MELCHVRRDNLHAINATHSTSPLHTMSTDYSPSGPTWQYWLTPFPLLPSPSINPIIRFLCAAPFAGLQICPFPTHTHSLSLMS